MAGIINIYKPGGITSFGVCAEVRKKLGISKAGHLGTLDPMAEGVLPVALGTASRIMEYLELDFKTYECRARLGLTTDTDDITGRVTGGRPDKEVGDEDIRGALMSFRGLREQVPPAYSAVRLAGKRLYDYARRGRPAEVPGREVYIRSVRFEGFDRMSKELSFTVECSKGTYIRSVARDLGAMLGTGAVLSYLRRTASGIFRIEEAVSLESFRSLSAEETEEIMIPVDRALTHFGRAVPAGLWEERLFGNGVRLRPDQWQREQEPEFAERLPEFPIREEYRHAYNVYRQDGRYIGVAFEKEGTLKADKVFADEDIQ